MPRFCQCAIQLVSPDVTLTINPGQSHLYDYETRLACAHAYAKVYECIGR